MADKEKKPMVWTPGSGWGEAKKGLSPRGIGKDKKGIKRFGEVIRGLKRTRQKK